MAHTFETALAKVTKNKEVKTLWNNWSPYLDNYRQNNLNVGMLPLFLCDKMDDIKKHLGKRQFHSLLREMAAFAAEEDSQTLVLTPNPAGQGQDWWTPVNPLWEAMVGRDSKAFSILLDYTPLEGVNRKIPAFELESLGMTINYMLPHALYSNIDKDVFYRLLSMTTSQEALEEAFKQTNLGLSGFYDGMKVYGREVIRGEIHSKIETQLELVKTNPRAAREQAIRAQKNSSLASVVSMFSNAFGGMFSSSKTVKVGGPK